MKRYCIIVLTCLASLTSCNSNKTESSTVLNSATNIISSPTTLPAWKAQQLAEEEEERKRMIYWRQNVGRFYSASVLNLPKSASRTDIIIEISRNLAEAKGTLAQFRASEFEVIRLVIANFVGEAVAAYEELLEAISASDQVKIAKALAQLEYLENQSRTVDFCVYQNNLNC
jgi:hypothetical protein